MMIEDTIVFTIQLLQSPPMIRLLEKDKQLFFSGFHLINFFD